MRLVALALLAALAALAAPAGAAELAALFPEEADVYVAGDGLARLELPLAVLRACEPDRSDLRLFDRAGNETPFLVDDAPRTTLALREERRVPARVLDLRREVVEREHAPSIYREAFDVTVPAGDHAGTWGLEVDASGGEFVLRIAVRTPDGDVLASGSVFRLGDGRQKRVLPLPPVAGDRLTVELEGEDGGFRTPRLTFVASRDIAPPPPATLPLAVQAIDTSGGVTTARTDLASIAPVALRFETDTSLFDRRVRVYEVGAREARRLVGSGRIFRVGAGAEQLDVPLAGTRGGRLVVEIDDGDSPPLAGLALSALGRLPALVFELPAVSDGTPAGTLRFGGGRARPARYDVSTLARRVTGETSASLAEALATLARRDDLARAWLGPVRANPAFDRTPVLAFAMQPGAPLDASGFRHRRPLRVRSSPDGLGQLRLTPADVAHARPDLSDLRVVDTEGRQWAYLLERDAATTAVPLTVQTTNREGSTSRHGLALPAPGAVIDALTLELAGPFFDRPYRLIADPGAETERVLDHGRLVRAAGAAVPITVEFPAERVAHLVLEVDDGDDAALAITGATARAPVPELFLAAPAGSYALLLGNPTADAPRYDLARVRDVVLALDGAPIAAGALEPNPAYEPPSPLAEGPERTTVLLWIVLGVAVVVLLVTTLRLAGGQRTGAA